jgi:hypothetical protein
LLGLVLAALVGLAIASLLEPEYRTGVSCGVLIALLIQAPLGWWTIRSIGTPRFQLVWVSGMLIRLMIVAIAAVVLAPAYGWNAAATLISLVAVLLVLLMIEAWTAVRTGSGTGSR